MLKNSEMKSHKKNKKGNMTREKYLHAIGQTGRE